MLRHTLPWSLSLLLSSASAGAASAGYWVDWSAPPGCGGVAQLEQEVAARSSNLRLEREGTFVSIEVERDPGGYHSGRVTLPDGTRREVSAVQCSDVVAALAFILVVVLDADRVTPDLPPLPPAQPPAEESAPVHWRSYVGATGGVAGGRTRQGMPVGGLFLELWQADSPFFRGARLSAVFGAGSVARAPDEIAALFGGAIVDLCPIGVSFASLCSGFELGAEHLQSGPALSNFATTRWSVSGRIGGQLRWALQDQWAFDLGLGALLPLTLDEFQIQRRDGTRDTVHDVAVSAYALVSIGYRL